MSKREADISNIYVVPKSASQKEMAAYLNSEACRREIDVLAGGLFYCERTRAKITREACLKRQALLSTAMRRKYEKARRFDDDEARRTGYVAEVCRDCPKGAQIAKEEADRMAAARKRTTATPFVCEKCGKGEKEGRKHRAHGLCSSCHQRLWKEGTLKEWIKNRNFYGGDRWGDAADNLAGKEHGGAKTPPSAAEEGKSVVVVMDSPIPAPPAGIALDSPLPKEKTAAAVSNDSPSAKQEAPVPVTLQWLSPRDKRLHEVLDLMALVHRRPLLQEVYSILENSAEDFLEGNTIFQDRGNMLKFKEEMNK